MRRMSPGWVTDLAILELSGSRIDDHGDHLVVRSPGNPDYHWGNCVLVIEPNAVDEAERWNDTFRLAFPTARWVAIGLPCLPRDADAWTSLSIDLEQNDVLTTSTMPRPSTLPAGYSVRQLHGDDWELAIARDLAENARTGEYEARSHEQFIRAAIDARRDLSERGAAAWFGAFAGEELCADLGIVRCGTVARYQAVGTESAHRRRGLASHLLGVAAAWSVEAGCTSWVIVTESENDAGRVYRRAGFTLDDAVVSAYRRPPLEAT
jgi:GNAT superfamily N-acetyltransferase